MAAEPGSRSASGGTHSTASPSVSKRMNQGRSGMRPGSPKRSGRVYYWASTNGYRIDNRGAAKQSNLPWILVACMTCSNGAMPVVRREGRVPAYYTTPEHTNVFRTGNFGGFLGLSSDLVNWTGATWYRRAFAAAIGSTPLIAAGWPTARTGIPTP